MRLPRLQFTVRRMMLAVAFAGGVFEVVLVKGRRELFNRRVADCLRWERCLGDAADHWKSKWDDERNLAEYAKERGLHDSASDWVRVAEEYRSLWLTARGRFEHATEVRRCWERVAAHPWESPPTELPHPEQTCGQFGSPTSLVGWAPPTDPWPVPRG